MEITDPLEQRDRWRALWQLFTHDAVFGIAGALMAFSAAAIGMLPQAPANSGSRAIDQWTAESRVQIGALFDTLNQLGLTAIAQSVWARVALIVFLCIALARLADRLMRVARDRGHTLQIEDELRVRVTDRAPALALMKQQLQRMRYRVFEHADELHATRAPLAALLSAAWHAAAIAAAIGLLANMLTGWDVSNELLTPGTPVNLQRGVALTLASEQSSTTQAEVQLDPANSGALLALNAPANIGATRIVLRQLSPGYRVSAIGPSNSALKIRTSNYLSPTTEAKLSFGAERALNLVVPEAQLALNIVQGEKPGEDRVTIVSIGSAQVISDTPIAPTLAITNAVFSFAPNINAVVSVQHRPGNGLMWAGFALATLGLVLSLLLPMRRMIIRHHSHWTEVYASGRNVRSDVRRLLQSL